MNDIKDYLKECQYQMSGINIKNFCESLEHNAELEFEYNGKEYVIQPIAEDNRHWLVAYLFDGSGKCDYLVREESFLECGREKEVVDKVLNTKCFEGKSSFEIYKDIQIIDWG